jgi:hypothetical protein
MQVEIVCVGPMLLVNVVTSVMISIMISPTVQLVIAMLRVQLMKTVMMWELVPANLTLEVKNVTNARMDMRHFQIVTLAPSIIMVIHIAKPASVSWMDQ